MSMRKRFVLVPLAFIALLSLSYHAHDYLAPWETASRQEPRYRDLLRDVNPLDRLPHSKTLGVASKIYVIGLAGGEDRRAAMEALQDAMDLTFTWHNATPAHAPAVTTALERVRQARRMARAGHAGALPAGAFPFAWPADVDARAPLRPDDVAGAERWFLPPASRGALPPLAPPPVPDLRAQEHVVQGTNEPNPDWPLKAVEIACWHSHFEVLRQIADGADEVALVFEDDIDMEWDLERRLRGLWRFLPADGWDMVMLGHCQSDEARRTALPGTSYLHPAQHTMCTHAYAVSRRGAARLVRILRAPLFAYSRPIDHAYIFLNGARLVDQFSVYPPVVVQTKRTRSDIGAGAGPGEEFFLADSALARVRAWEARIQRRGRV